MHPASDRRRRGYLLAVLPAALALSLTSVPSALGQGSAQGSFGITPARRNVVAKPPTTLVPTRVSNTTQAPYAVRVFAVVLRQDLTGAFQFSESPRALHTAAHIMGVSPARFRLAPGQSRSVALRWRALPRKARTAYIGVVFQGQPRLAGKRSVGVISRLLSVNFLRVPGKYHSRGSFTALHAIQFAPRVLRFLPRVKNTGDIFDTPQGGRLTIRDASGHRAYATSWIGDVVIPGAQREFPIDVHRILQKGNYTATATMSFGANRHAKISLPFTLVGPNQLPTPSVKIGDFAAHGYVGDPAHVSGQVQSTGTAPVDLNLSLSLYRVTAGQAGSMPMATRTLRYSRLAPGSTRSLGVELGKLTKGSYRVIANYTDPTRAPQQLTTDFLASPHKSLWDRIKDFLKRHETLLLALLALVVVAVLGSRLLRRQRRLEAELREARADADADADTDADGG